MYAKTAFKVFPYWCRDGEREKYLYHTHNIPLMTNEKEDEKMTIGELGKNCDAHGYVDEAGVSITYCDHCEHTSSSVSEATKHFREEHKNIHTQNKRYSCPSNTRIDRYDDVMIEDNEKNAFEILFDIPQYVSVMEEEINVAWNQWSNNIGEDTLGRSLNKLCEKHNITLDSQNIRLETRENDRGNIIFTVWWRSVVA